MPAAADAWTEHFVWSRPPSSGSDAAFDSGTFERSRSLRAMGLSRRQRSESIGNPPRPSDEDLMESFVAGDARAFETLVHRHGRALYSFLLRSVNNASRAEELLQDVLLRVVRSKSRYRRSAKFSTWMFTIARNLCVDESRRARFRDHESLDAPRRGAVDGERRTPLSALPAQTVPTDEAADAPRLRARLCEAVQELPEDQREVFLMRQLGGLSFREIGDAVGAPENTVKSRMRYALDKLRDRLADVYSTDPQPPESAQDEGLSHG